MQFAAVFPGQGSQSTGMLSELAESYSEVGDTFQEGSDVLGKDLWALCQDETQQDLLNQTINTQPVMLAAGIAVWRIWQSQGGSLPVGMAGHSLGEYSALVAAGDLDFKTAMELVAKRAALMQQAVPEGSGAMAAILGLDDDVIVNHCAEITRQSGKGLVEAVNFNSPGQVVIAGNTDAVDLAIESLKESGAKRAIKLPVSVPSHCSLMKDAASQLAKALEEVVINADTPIPVIQNFEATSYQSANDIKTALSNQIYKPVMWVDTINNLSKELGAESIVEFGPGKVLFGLNRRINRQLGNICISDAASLEKALKMCE